MISSISGGIYIHIPFCSHKCLYCDFYTGGARIADWDRYVNALQQELQIRYNEINFIPHTLYIGGGTPSLIPSDIFIELIEIIQKETGIKSWKEFTLEVNPEDVTEDKIITWKKAGVNRISMGVQSFIDEELKLIGRQHDALQAEIAFKLLKSEFSNISIDIMFGIPGQSLASYRKSLEKAFNLGPAHISSYSLMLEDGTAMTHLVKKKKIPLPEETEWLKMFELTTTLLSDAGYDRYEISNYALPGMESIHNLSYWQGKPYLGLGPGAHSYDGSMVRRANKNDIKGYLRHYSPLIIHKRLNTLEASLPFYIEEHLSQDELQEEMIMTRLRTIEGLNLIEFESRFGKSRTCRLIQSAQKFINRGEMIESNRYLSFSPAGFLLSDSILPSLI